MDTKQAIKPRAASKVWLVDELSVRLGEIVVVERVLPGFFAFE